MERITINVPNTLKRQLKEIANDKKITMTDLIVHALKNYVEDTNFQNSYPKTDLLMDRMNQILTSQMAIVKYLKDQQN